MSSFRFCSGLGSFTNLQQAKTIGDLHAPSSNSAVLMEGDSVSVGTILLIILVLFLVGAFPTWPHSANWGYYPSSGAGILLIIVLILLLTGRL